MDIKEAMEAAERIEARYDPRITCGESLVAIVLAAEVRRLADVADRTLQKCDSLRIESSKSKMHAEALTQRIAELEKGDAQRVKDISHLVVQRDKAMSRAEAAEARVAELERGHNDLWGQWQGLSAKLTAAEAEARRLREALEKISRGEGYYGMQAFEYKQIARAALAEEQDNG